MIDKKLVDVKYDKLNGVLCAFELWSDGSERVVKIGKRGMIEYIMQHEGYNCEVLD